MGRSLIYTGAHLLMLFFTTCLIRCKQEKQLIDNYPKLFTLVSPDSSGVFFRNDIREDEYTNAIVYQYAYIYIALFKYL